MKPTKKNRMKLLMLGFGLWALGFGLWGNEARADTGNPFYGNIEAVVVDASFGLSTGQNSKERKSTAEFLLNSKAISRENIENIAAEYLKKKLKNIYPVIIAKNGLEGFPMESYLIKFNYTVWDQDIDGTKTKFGAISLRSYRMLRPDYQYLIAQYQWEPVETFLISDDPKKQQKSLEDVIHRMLEQYPEKLTSQLRPEKIK